MARTLSRQSSRGAQAITTTRRSKRRPLKNASTKTEAGLSPIWSLLYTSMARRSRLYITISAKALSRVKARWLLMVGV
ncbi:hypothetical protein FQZ97_972730 [compost metagenome]